MFLQASPDGIRDLAAAVQHALAAVTHQTAVPPVYLQHMRQDLVRMANFVCLLAWRLHLRSRRARRLQQQQQLLQPGLQGGQGQDNQSADADFDAGGVVVVVLNDEDEVHLPAAQEVQQEELAGAQQQEEEHVQGLLDHQQDQLLEVTVDAGQQQQHADMPHLQQQQQQLATVVAPAPAPAHVSLSVAVQTDDVAPTMRQIHELLSGLMAVMQPDNPSLKPGRATLALLTHQIEQQLQASNLPQHQPQVLPPQH